MTIPFIGALAEKTTTDISFNNIFTGATAATLQGVPWRVTKLNYSYSNSGFIIQDGREVPAIQPAFFQICLNSAATDNVESIVSRRHLSSNVVQRGRMFPLSPNPWKEDEDRNQALITVDNITFGGGTPNSVISFLLHVHLEFGNVPYTHPSTRLHHHAPRMQAVPQSPFSSVSLEDI